MKILDNASHLIYNIILREKQGKHWRLKISSAYSNNMGRKNYQLWL